MDREGHLAMPFNTAIMYRGWIDQDGRVTVATGRDAAPNESPERR